MWHPEFKPHDQDSMPDLPLASLPKHPQHSIGHKTSTVSEFVSKMTDTSTIVQRALRLSNAEEEAPKDEFSDMAKKYGISADTLRLIKKK